LFALDSVPGEWEIIPSLHAVSGSLDHHITVALIHRHVIFQGLLTHGRLRPFEAVYTELEKDEGMIDDKMIIDYKYIDLR
jgi:hypothetical protein